MCIVLSASRFLAYDINLLRTVEKLTKSLEHQRSNLQGTFFAVKQQTQEWMGSASFNTTLIPPIFITLWELLEIQTDAP